MDYIPQDTQHTILLLKYICCKIHNIHYFVNELYIVGHTIYTNNIPNDSTHKIVFEHFIDD